jgi:serine/threonine protein phosphatase PrpC
MRFAERTDIGCVRATNDDAVGSWPERGIFAVADGVSALPGAAQASRIALDAFGAAMAEAPIRWPVTKRMRVAVQSANLAVHTRTLNEPRLRRMRTTLTATVVAGGTIVTAHVGDCRLYVLRDGALRRVTQDHNWAAHLVRFRLLRPDAARRHRHRHILTRCLGENPIVRVDVAQHPVYAGDILLQCSDGLHALIGEAEMTAVLATCEPEAACAELVARARAAGGDDNVSVQVAALMGADGVREQPGQDGARAEYCQ